MRRARRAGTSCGKSAAPCLLVFFMPSPLDFILQYQSNNGVNFAHYPGFFFYKKTTAPRINSSLRVFDINEMSRCYFYDGVPLLSLPILSLSLCPTNQRFYDSRTFSFNLGRARGEHVPHASPWRRPFLPLSFFPFRYLGLHLAASRSDGRAHRRPPSNGGSCRPAPSPPISETEKRENVHFQADL